MVMCLGAGQLKGTGFDKDGFPEPPPGSAYGPGSKYGQQGGQGQGPSDQQGGQSKPSGRGIIKLLSVKLVLSFDIMICAEILAPLSVSLKIIVSLWPTCWRSKFDTNKICGSMLQKY